MSSEDVIELGSSDEEPAPKKSKPPPNQMVCIPKTLGDVTITPTTKSTKPAAKSIVPASLATGLARKGITVKKVTNSKFQPNNQSKHNGKLSPQILKPMIGVNPFSGIQKGVKIPVKPLSTAERLIKSGLIKVIPKQSVPITPVSKSPRSRSSVPQLTNPIIINNKNTGALNLLPNISLKKTTTIPIPKLKKGKPQITKQRKNIGEILTVELDDEADDKPSSRNASPQWYIKPEDYSPAGSTATPEEENNKEPEPSNLIEITIEDSPVKPIPNKRTHEVGAELAITIDDSPVKATAGKRPHTSGSESDENSSSTGKEPPSKKKLNYPKETEDTKTIEIEINPLETISKDDSTDKDNNDAAKLDDVQSKTDKEEKGENSEKNKEVEELPEMKKTNELEKKTVVDITNATTEPSEFNPAYQSFIDLCFKLENSDDMFKIVEKKIKGYYRQVPKEYTDSEEFTDMVSSKILAMKAGPEKMYLYIKDIVDELNLQRKLAKAHPIVQETKSEEQIQLYEDGEREYGNSKRQRQIRKLEKTIKKLHRAIQKLEEQEVDFEDEDDSVYLLTERYKERMVRVYAKFCQLSNTKMPSEPRILIDARPGQPTGPAKRLEKWINKKVPIGTPLPFPDFHDVLRCVRDANDEDRLGWNEVDVMEEARDLFTRCGRKLQRRRQENEWRSAASRIPQEVDPAENNPDLKRKLSENKKIASHKETEIFNKYADRQKQLKLEGEEIGDKEAEESPVESEEEAIDENENASKESREQRKERLKRLLHKKSRKSTEDKGNKVLNENPTDENIEKSEPAVETETVVKETDSKELKSNKQNNKEESKYDEKKVDENKLDGNKSDETKLDVNKESENKLNDTKENETIIKKEQKTEQPNNNKKTAQNATETLTLSDDSSALESDVDELHLLQKLHSANEVQSSSADSDDSDSPIAISDSLDSDDDNKKETNDNDDVISIENSSYSEDDGETIHFINDDSSQDGIVNLITPKKKEGATSQSADQITDDESKEDKHHNTQASNTDIVQLIHDDSSPGENCEQINDEVKENSSARLVIEHIVSDHSNTASQDSDAPVVTGESATEVIFPSVVNLKAPENEPNEPVEDITLASSDEETVNTAKQKDNAVSLEDNTKRQQDNTVDQNIIANCQVIDAVSLKDKINCPELNKRMMNVDCQAVNADCLEYNPDYQKENANYQDNNPVGQQGNADYQEDNAISHEDNAVGQDDNVVGEEKNCKKINEDCEEYNAVGQEQDAVGREGNAVGKKHNAIGDEGSAVVQLDISDCQEMNADYQEGTAVAQEENVDSREVNDQEYSADHQKDNTDSQEYNTDYQEDNVDAQKGKEVCHQDNVDCQEVNADCQEIDADCLEANVDCQEVNSDCQEVNADCQEVNSDCQEVNSDCQEVNADCLEVNADCLEVNADCQDVNSDYLEINADCHEVNADCQEVDQDIEEITDSQEENADSQEENVDSQEENGDSQEEECVNLKDDLISIDETVVGNINVANKLENNEPPTIAVEEVDDSSGEVVISESTEPEDVEMKSQSGDDDVQINEEPPQEDAKSNQSSEPIETMEIDDDDDNTMNESVASRGENGTTIISLES